MANARRADVADRAARAGATAQRVWVERLQLTDFRNYAQPDARASGPSRVVLTGANGAGKTNLLEAVSLLAPGQGLRRAPYPELARGSAHGGWAVAAHAHTPHGAVDIGTGLSPAGRRSRPRAAASCASTARRRRAPARSPTTSRWSG